MRGYGSTQESLMASVSGSFMGGNPADPPPALDEGMHCLIASTLTNVIGQETVVNSVASITYTLSMGEKIYTVLVNHIISEFVRLIFLVDDRIIITEALRYIIPWPISLVLHDNQV
ncbi:hypothetical protein AXF42_Ash004345 [Apostasia shenzhenica]|uniref:Transposase Tnp1/En/Spm-like domain-containing protein n=1 Tax=Apostasia shenzhenica TaxID=1088818 RepID=A0A2I0A2R2_9ASPA|nr:hypothetical protein AXF42_Ash004345 [Apostasia shenzhenica]